MSEVLRVAPWWRSAVFYEIYPRSFQDSDGDGVGDLRGVADRLDYLQWLGIDAVWLGPVFSSPQADNGYDVSDYLDVDPLFGDVDALVNLVALARERGIRFVLDLVVNHTSDRHAWFVESRNPLGDKRDWYIWRPPREGFVGGAVGAEPNNWRSAFGGSAWTFDPASDEYYLHLFSPEQPDLNWENPAVRAAVHDVMLWWLARGVAGFRLDVINFISKDPELPDAVAVGEEPLADGSAFYLNGPRVHEYLAEMRAAVSAVGDGVVLVGETPGVDVAQGLAYSDAARCELDMIFQFEHCELDRLPQRWLGRELDVLELRETFARWQLGLAGRGWNSLFLGNHDMARVVSRYGDDGEYRELSAMALATFLHAHQGTPFIYQGDEIAMGNARLEQESDLRDVEAFGLLAESGGARGSAQWTEVMEGIQRFGRDNARTPMAWDSSETAGFTSGEPWIGLSPGHRANNVGVQQGVAGSVLEFYRALIALRHREPALATGGFEELNLPGVAGASSSDVGSVAGGAGASVLSVIRRRDEDTGRTLVILTNLGADDVAVPGLVSAQCPEGGAVVLANYPDRVGRLTPNDLRPWETVILEVSGARSLR